MFKVINIETGVVSTVYGMNGPHFLFWEEGTGWYYDYMSKYKPYIPEDSGTGF